MLSVAGSLQLSDHGSPAWPHISDTAKGINPKVLNPDTGDGLSGWYTTTPNEKSNVRSLFTIQKRSLQLPMLALFDQPDANRSCARRFNTTVAPQALLLLNSDFAVETANRFANRVAREAGVEPGDRVDTAFRTALARLPDEEERKVCLQLLQTHTIRHTRENIAAPDLAALIDLCRALMNTNEFLYVD